jgi:hypothetical protein
MAFVKARGDALSVEAAHSVTVAADGCDSSVRKAWSCFAFEPSAATAPTDKDETANAKASTHRYFFIALLPHV